MRRRVLGSGPRWVVAVAVAGLLAGCGGVATGGPDAEGVAAAPTSGAAGSGDVDGEAGAAAAPQATVEPPPAEPPSADQLAGVLSREVPDAGTGDLVTVPGVTSAPGDGEEWQVRVSVEGGLDVDAGAFADFVMLTLNDPRGWTVDGYTFSRTDGDEYDVEVVLASPQTSAAMCAPLQTFGKLSCRNGDRAVITHFRWVGATEDYADDLTGYRHYVISHEVGHALGRGHVGCPSPGELAPVMLQQTKGLQGCMPNPWPYP